MCTQHYESKRTQRQRGLMETARQRREKRKRKIGEEGWVAFVKVSRDTPLGVLSFHSYRDGFVSRLGEGLSTKGCEESIGRPDFTPVCTRVSCCIVFLAIPATISCRLINTCNGRNWLSLGRREDGRVDKKNRREQRVKVIPRK